MNLIIDIGNTRIKTAVFDSNVLIEYKAFDYLLVCDAEFILRNFSKIRHCIVCSTGKFDAELQEYLANTFPDLIYLTGNSKLPFTNHYKTKETQGPDRIAAIAGAQYLYPNSDILIIDAGTAITYDFIDKSGNYSGGNIAPGLQMRFKALHTFTEKLPLLELSAQDSILGNDTQSAIINGVQNGLIFEVEGYIEKLNVKFPELKVIITGGDAEFLANKIKYPIFADQHLVLKGLNRILQHNAIH